jgi:hypothetical protein
MHSSPAFAPPGDIALLERDFRVKADVLRTEIVRLQKVRRHLISKESLNVFFDQDLDQDGRTIKKLNAFVEKWDKSSN